MQVLPRVDRGGDIHHKLAACPVEGDTSCTCSERLVYWRFADGVLYRPQQGARGQVSLLVCELLSPQLALSHRATEWWKRQVTAADL